MFAKSVPIRSAVTRLSDLIRFRILLGLRPGFFSYVIDGFHEVGDARYSCSRYYEAAVAYKVILHLSPRDRSAVFKLVGLYRELCRYDDGINCLKKWLILASTDWQAHLCIAEFYVCKREISKAQEHIDIASRLNAEASLLLTSSGYLSRIEGDLEKSSEYFRASLEIRQTPPALLYLAENLKDGNQRAEAIELLERTIQLAPDDPWAYQSLASAKYYREHDHRDIAHIKQLLAKGGLPRPVRRGFHFILGDVFDHLGSWDEAFTHFKTANDQNATRYDAKPLERMVNSLIKTFDLRLLEASGERLHEARGESLVFIVGMPRSGSTLLEQILASHPQVCAGGERVDIFKIVLQLPAELGTKAQFPQCVLRLDPGAVDHVTQPYLALVSELADGAARFVDKSLGNYLHIGLIALLFPRAKVIHCRRFHLDTCISCYFKNFNTIAYTNNLTSIGVVYHHYLRMMSHWHSVLPGFVLDVGYEDLVSNPETEIRRLLEFCELPWHPGCLDHQRTKRVVLTCSADQVKLPIYSKSVGRWKNYRKHIQPLMDILGPV